MGDKFDNLIDIESISEVGLNMTQIHLLIPSIKRPNYLGFDILRDTTNSHNFNPQNIILPIISEVTEETISSVNYPIISALHVERNASSNQTSQLTHYSKVLSALCKPIGSEVPTIATPYNIAYPNGDIYDNCIAIFKKFRNSTDISETLLNLTSSPLKLDTRTNFINYMSNGYGYNQHNQNTMVRWTVSSGTGYGGNNFGTNTNVTLIGAKTNEYPFKNREGFTPSTQRNLNHTTTLNSGNPEQGEMYSAQMLLKPQFNITNDLTAGTGLDFTMNTSSTHHWLNYVPNLKGYYIVGDKLESGNLPSATNISVAYVSSGVPKYIGKITSHTLNGTGTYNIHSLKFDKDIDVSEQGLYYRLMRISDTTFEDTPDYIEINTMHDSGLKYEIIPENLLTGEISTKDQYGEGIYSMYMLLNIDEGTSDYLERRDISNIGTLFSDGDEIDCYITDGVNSQRKSLTVTYIKVASSGVKKQLKFEYDGKLNGNGCVSFGEVFNITIPKKLKINPTHCYLGTTFSIGGIIENEIENIAKDSGIELNYEQSLRDYTGNVVSSVSSNVITCIEQPIDVETGDILYTQQGYLVGKVNSISNTTITIDSIIFVPSAYDELIRRQSKTHVSNVNFEDVDAFSAINYLASKRGLDYKISNGEIIARNIEDVHGLRKYSINYK